MRLAEDLLVLARSAEHRPAISVELVDPRGLVDREVEAFSTLAARHRCTIGSRVLVDRPVSLDLSVHEVGRNGGAHVLR